MLYYRLKNINVKYIVIILYYIYYFIEINILNVSILI